MKYVEWKAGEEMG